MGGRISGNAAHRQKEMIARSASRIISALGGCHRRRALSYKAEEIPIDAVLAGDLGLGIAHERPKPVEVDGRRAHLRQVCTLQEARAIDAAYLATALECSLQKAAGNWELEFTTDKFVEQSAAPPRKEREHWAAALLLARGASFS